MIVFGVAPALIHILCHRCRTVKAIPATAKITMDGDQPTARVSCSDEAYVTMHVWAAPHVGPVTTHPSLL